MVDDVLENLFQTVDHGQSGEARSLVVGLFAPGCFWHGLFFRIFTPTPMKRPDCAAS
jgi:hypothetical protein